MLDRKCTLYFYFLHIILFCICSGISMTVMPTYISEIAPVELRGAVGSLCPLGVTSGVVLAQIISLPQILGNILNKFCFVNIKLALVYLTNIQYIFYG